MRPGPYVCALVIGEMRSIASLGPALTLAPNATSIAWPAWIINRDEAPPNWTRQSVGLTIRRIVRRHPTADCGERCRVRTGAGVSP